MMVYRLFLFCAFAILVGIGTSFCQSPSLSHTAELEAVINLVEKSMKFGDKRLNVIADSIAKLGDEEKTELAGFYRLYLQSRKGNDYDKTLEQLRRLQPVINGYKSPVVKVLSKFYLGYVHVDGGNLSRGLEMMLEAIGECKSVGYDKVPLLGQMYYVLSNLYYGFGSYRRSIEFARLSVRYKDRGKTCTALNTWGMAYQKMELYDSAIIKFKETIAAAQKENVPVWVSIAASNLGRTLCLKKDYAAGVPLLLHDVMTNQDAAPINCAISALYLADVNIQLKQPDSAAYYINLAKTIFTTKGPGWGDQFNRSQFAYQYYQQLSELEKMKGDYSAALQHADSAYAVKDKRRNDFDQKVILAAEKRIEGLEYERNLDVLRARKQAQTIIFIVVFVSLLIIAFVLISRQRLRLKNERQLAQAKEANLLLRQQQGERELEQAKQQLDVFVKNIAEKNELIEKITEQLQALSETQSDASHSSDLSEAKEQLYTASLLTNEKWEEFKVHFEKVYTGFFTELNQTLPGISPAEERLLALAKLNIDNKQIGNMLGISPASVRTAKYRLRRKFKEIDHSILDHLLPTQEGSYESLN